VTDKATHAIATCLVLRLTLSFQTEKFVKKYLCEQVKMIKLLGDHVTNLKRVGPGLGVYLFGRHTLKTRVQKRKLLRRLKLDSSSSSSSDSDSDVE